jgi:predicted acyltransferase
MNQVEKSVPLTIAGRNKLTTQILSYLLVVLLCMYRIIRPDYEVVKEGRILHS